MRFFVPFDTRDPKTRLSSMLDADERRDFAAAMLTDVLGAVRGAGHEPTVLATEAVDVDAPVTVDDRPLTPAVQAAIDGADPPVAVLVADLPLATPAAVDRLLDPEADVAFAPGLGGGTNAILVRSPEFVVDFHGASIRDHRTGARDAGLSTATVDSFRLAVDVDEPTDLAEVCLHGEGAAADWLRDAGVTVSVDGGRVEPTRTGEDGGDRG